MRIVPLALLSLMFLGCPHDAGAPAPASPPAVAASPDAEAPPADEPTREGHCLDDPPDLPLTPVADTGQAGETRIPILGGKAEVVFPAGALEFTAAELSAGVELTYAIEIKEELSGIETQSLVSYTQDPSSPQDLLPLASVVGGGQSYCPADFGRGMRKPPEARTVPTGRETYSLRWSGRNWGGPSCTGEEPKDPFPPGTYAFTVRLSGTLGEPYQVEASVPLVIKP